MILDKEMDLEDTLHWTVKTKSIFYQHFGYLANIVSVTVSSNSTKRIIERLGSMST